LGCKHQGWSGFCNQGKTSFLFLGVLSFVDPATLQFREGHALRSVFCSELSDTLVGDALCSSEGGWWYVLFRFTSRNLRYLTSAIERRSPPFHQDPADRMESIVVLPPLRWTAPPTVAGLVKPAFAVRESRPSPGDPKGGLKKGTSTPPPPPTPFCSNSVLWRFFLPPPPSPPPDSLTVFKIVKRFPPTRI